MAVPLAQDYACMSSVCNTCIVAKWHVLL